MRWSKYSISWAVSFLVLMLWVSREANAEANELTISQPASGVVLKPGDRIGVTVQQSPSLPRLYFTSGVGLLVNGPFLMSSPTGYDPYTFTISVLTNAQPGDYKLVATGSRAGTASVYTPGIDLVVQAQGLQSIIVPINPVALNYIGAMWLINIEGLAADGTIMSMPSTQCSYQSDNSTIASVSTTGVVSASGVGTASISISCQGLTATVSVTVLRGPRGDLNADGRVDIDDLNILGSALNMPANGPNDARDLNHDGIINALDAGILTSLCTYPECATRSGSTLIIGAASATPNVLWPPNQKTVPVALRVPTSGGSGAVSCSIAWVASNEPIDPGGDWIITGNLTLDLVANRLDTGTGRIYTMEVECRDGSGNSAAKSVLVNVPHDQGN
jgi:hypothetical protein